MNYRKRLTYLMFLDSLIVSTAIFIAAWVVYPNGKDYSFEVIIVSAIVLLTFHHLFAIFFNLYNKVWSYASVGELMAITKSITLSAISVGIVQLIVNDFILYNRALLVTWMIHIILIGGSRFVWRVYRDRHMKKTELKKRVLIVGAGDAGAMVVRHLQHNQKDSDLLPIGFIDDDQFKQRMQIYNLSVHGTMKDIEKVVEKEQIDLIVIAIPSLCNEQLNRIMNECLKTRAKVQMLPKLEDLMTGKVSVNALKNVEVEDLLGRVPVELDINTITKYVTGYTVMITGAGGSIGSELCRQLIRFSPRRIILLGHGEFSIYKIDMELRETFNDLDVEIIPVIADVQDREHIFDMVNQYRPTHIYHAAAHKHVPLMESNPHVAVKNNIIGTRNVAEAADAFNVETFVMVSTDKAVNPTSVMGATKRISEMIVQGLAKTSQTKFVAVRFGNVLGSRGSVIPLFKKQIAQGGPVTVTDPEMTRYFMTIPEASRLVIQAGTLGHGGEIFVLDMGEPVKIVDLAKNLIKLSGYSEDDICIKYSGIRPGEKMYEELLGKDEVLPGKVHDKIYVGRTVEVDPIMIDNLLINFNDYDDVELKEVLMRIVFMEKTLMSMRSQAL